MTGTHARLFDLRCIIFHGNIFIAFGSNIFIAFGSSGVVGLSSGSSGIIWFGGIDCRGYIGFSCGWVILLGGGVTQRRLWRYRRSSVSVATTSPGMHLSGIAGFGVGSGGGSIVLSGGMDGICCRNKIYRDCVGFVRFPRRISRLGEKDGCSTALGAVLEVAVPANSSMRVAAANI